MFSDGARRDKGWTAAAMLAVAAWFAVVTYIKIKLYYSGVSVGDLYLHANAIVNTSFPEKILYTAAYHAERGITTLMQDHFEPSSLLLIPFYKIFDSPLFLVMLQALGPAFVVFGLVRVNRHFHGASWLGWAAAALALYNPAYMKAVIDGAGGYRHDAQFLVYAPLFLAFFIERRWLLTALALALFLGVKQNAAFYGIGFGFAVAALGLPFGAYRRAGAAVAAASAAYFVFAVFIAPKLINSPNIYVQWGASAMGAEIIFTAVKGFFEQKWHSFYIYFIYALPSIPFYVAGGLDVAAYGVLGRSSTVYYNFNIVSFLAFGVLATGLWLQAAQGSLGVRFRRLFTVALAVHIVGAVGFGLWEARHILAKNMNAAVVVSAADMEAAWGAVDLACGVSPQDPLLIRFHRAPYWIRPLAADKARHLVTIDQAILSDEARRRDPLHGFIAANSGTIEAVGRFGVLTVWRNAAAPCRPWE